MSAPRSLPAGLKPYRVSSAFGVIRNINGRNTPPHNGADWATPTGIPLEATMAGEVSLVGGSLTHIWGYYVHVICACPLKHVQEFHILRDLPKFKIGDPIRVGQIIGHTGSSGSLNGKRYAPHHHHGLSVGGTYYNPLNIGWPETAGDDSTTFDNTEGFMSALTHDEQRDLYARIKHLDSQTTGADGQKPSLASRIIDTEAAVAKIGKQTTNLDRQVLGTDGYFADVNVVQRLINLQGSSAAVDVDALAEAIVKRLPAGQLTAAAVVAEIRKQWAK